MSHPTPFPELNQVLANLVRAVERSLAEDFVGAYLQGSLATGGFDRHSDCDFIVVVEQELNDRQAAVLEQAYQRVFNLEIAWAKHLEGSFFPRDMLRDYQLAGQDIWYVDHGSRELERSAHDNTVVVRWILLELGVVLAGPPPRDLIDPIPVRSLRLEMYRIFREWGEVILADPHEIGSQFYQTFAVLSYCRFLHNLDAGIVGSKRAGADWAQAHLEPEWHDLIDRAWAGRPDPARSVRTPADRHDLWRTLEFIERALERADRMAHGLGLL